MMKHHIRQIQTQTHKHEQIYDCKRRCQIEEEKDQGFVDFEFFAFRFWAIFNRYS